MTKTFRTFPNRLDKQLMCFDSDDVAALLHDICTNSATGHVRQLRESGPVSVPYASHAKVVEHLKRLGWRHSN